MTLSEAQKRKIEEEEKYRPQAKSKYSSVLESKTSRNRIAATLLAILLGDSGIHKFYRGKSIQGFIYLIFFWTFLLELICFFSFKVRQDCFNC